MIKGTRQWNVNPLPTSLGIIIDESVSGFDVVNLNGGQWQTEIHKNVISLAHQSSVSIAINIHHLRNGRRSGGGDG